MKKNIILVVLLLSGSAVYSQNNNNAVSLDELRAPSSPGFSILGVQPTEISRPSSWKTVQTTLSNSFFENDKLIIPKNFAMEFNPFFMNQDSGARVYRTFANQNNNVSDAFKNHSNISVATGMLNSYADTSMKNQRMGVGYRTQLWEMHPTVAAKNTFIAFKGKQVGITQLTNIMMQVEAELESKFSIAKKDNKRLLEFDLTNEINSRLNNDTIKALWNLYLKPVLENAKNGKQLTTKKANENENVHNNNIAIIKLLYEEIAKLDKQEYFTSAFNATNQSVSEKFGFSLELASAFLFDFPTNDIAFSKVPKFGIWITPSYRFKNQIWEIGGMIRYINSKFDKAARQNNFDFGARAMIGGSKWSLNGELIQRVQWQVLSNSTGANGASQASIIYSYDFKMSLTANYMVTDNIIINYTFGNGFTVNTEFNSPTGNLISSVGIVYALGGPKMTTNGK